MTMAGSKDGIGGPMATGSSGPNIDGDGDTVTCSHFTLTCGFTP